ncbi:hypothetical protein EVAR_70444_1 [Eumeta japonica]|uniref:Peptidase A2 domain-containing protein n=1 Tax=Eumeta variegata TaxID=151549 RepID=A0A4C1TT17_EUMVA|nr:hypothetical protein EVAR_70444_1 [Eumeta japonica]
MTRTVKAKEGNTINKVQENKMQNIKTNAESPDNVDTVFITLPCQQARKGKLVLLVDTGADFSIVKEESMKNFPNQNRIRTSILTGAFGGRASTLGTTEIRIADKMQPSWVFHIVSQEIKIQGDGILGRDNMWNKCIINTIDKTLNIFDKEHSMKTFTLYTSEECEKVDTQKVCLTKRAVTIVPVNIITKEKQWLSINRKYSGSLRWKYCS